MCFFKCSFFLLFLCGCMIRTKEGLILFLICGNPVFYFIVFFCFVGVIFRIIFLGWFMCACLLAGGFLFFCFMRGEIEPF